MASAMKSKADQTATVLQPQGFKSGVKNWDDSQLPRPTTPSLAVVPETTGPTPQFIATMLKEDKTSTPSHQYKPQFFTACLLSRA